MRDTDRCITAEGLASCAAKLLPAQALLLCSRATIGEVRIALSPVCTNQGFKSLVCRNGVSNEFLYYVILMLKPQMVGRAIGSTFLEIGRRDVAAIEVLMPSYEEQAAIAEALSDVDRLLGALDALITKKQAIKYATSQQLLSGTTRLPPFAGEWKTKPLGELGTFLRGNGVRRDDALSGPLGCVRYGEIYTTHHDYIRSFHSWISPAVAATATRLKLGDLLFAGSGETKEDIGKCVAFVVDAEGYAGGDIVILRPTGVDPLFFGYALNAPNVARQKASLGQGDAVVHITPSALAQVTVPLPGIREQTAIATVLSDIDAEIAALEARRDKTRTIKQGIMQQLINGRVRLMKPAAGEGCD